MLDTWTVTLLAATALACWAIDYVFFYPFFRDPVRVFPRGTWHATPGVRTTLLTEKPRGKTALRWMKQFPAADAVSFRGFFGWCIVVPASPAALRDVLSTHVYDFQKPTGIRAFLARILGYGLVLTEGDVHKKQRAALTPAFHIRNIRALYGFMWEKTLDLNARLETEMAQHGEVEMTLWSSRYTLDIIGPAALGHDFRSLETSNHDIADAFEAILEPDARFAMFMGASMLIPQWALRWLPSKVNHVLDRNATFLRKSCHDILRQRRKQAKHEGDDDDIMTQIIDSGSFTDDEVVDQMLTFLAAGHETTASALVWSLYMLARDPPVQQKLRAEVHAALASVREAGQAVGYTAFEAAPYLNGVCEEILRLYPTVPLTIRQAVRRTTMAGTPVDKGTPVLLIPYAVNRNPAFWGPDADELRPERWIDSLPDGTTRFNKHGGAPSNYCVLTFLHGHRSCIGQSFAKAELRCAIAGIVSHFDVKLADPDEVVEIGGMVTGKPVKGMRLVLHKLD